MCCSCCGVLQQKIWLFLTATIFLASGLILVISWRDFATNYTYKILPLTAGSFIYDKWVETPIPVYLHIYLFNWTNPEQVRIKRVKPHFEEIGPFVYREEKIKEDVTWNSNKTVSFFGKRTWYFEPELSGAPIDVPITCPHIPSLAAAYTIRNKPRLVKFAFNRVLNNNGGALYATHTAGEWLFDAFYDELLDYAMKLNSSLSPPIDTNEFAWFLNRNGSKEFDGLFTIHTGQGNLRQMGEIKFWNGLNHTGYFDDECGRINGSTSDLWVPNRSHDEYITIYITDTCRIINLMPTAETKVAGIKAIKYETQPDTFDNGQRNTDMKCYCPKELQPNNCPATGATHMGSCTQDLPIFLSHPHFMYADESYAHKINGMEPNYDRHKFFITMEPKLGIPLQVNANVMVSLQVRNDSDITILHDINDFYAPLLTISSKAEVTDELASEIKRVLSLPAIGFWIGVGLISIGGIIGAIGIYLTATHNWYSEYKKT